MEKNQSASWFLFKICILVLFYLLISKSIYSQNHALYFDGTNDYVEINNYMNMSPTSAVTIEAWIKGNITPVLQYVYDRVEQNDGYGITINATGHARVTINGGNGTAISSSIVLNGQWNHIAGTYDQSTGLIQVFVNGILEGTSNFNSNITYTPEPRNGIGGPGATNGTYFNGFIDDVRVWNYARSQSQIQMNMCTTLIPATLPGLIAYWRLNEGNGITTSDFTINGNHGTLKNGVSWVIDSACVTTGSQELLNTKTDITIYPNPAKDKFSINSVTGNLKIFNSLGEKLYSQYITNPNTTIDISHFSKGIYSVFISSENSSAIRKLIVY